MSRRAAKAPAGFPARLQLVRQRMGLSQEELAKLLEVSQQSVQLWESGQRIPSRRSWAIIAHRLGYTRDELEHGRAFTPPETAAAEDGHRRPTRSVSLIPLRAGSEVMRMSTTGLSAEALTLAQAQKLLSEAVKAGRAVWLVVE